MKYVALTLQTLALLLVGYALFGLYGLSQRTLANRPSAAVTLRPLPERAAVDGGVVATLDAIGQLGARARAARAAGGGAGLPLLALAPPGTPGAVGPAMPQRDVTMLLQGDAGPLAMIDDRLVGVGARLPGGGRVLSIGRDQVLVRETQGRQTLSVPIDRLRVGVLRSRVAPAATVTQQRFEAGARFDTTPAPGANR